MTADREAQGPPERDAPEEALLLNAWADGLEPAEELPEEVLALLDGSASAEVAERARRLMAERPELAATARDWVASLRETDLRESGSLDREAPARLLAEAIDLVPPKAEPRARSGPLSRWSRWVTGLATPGLAAAAAAVLLVTFVMREREALPPDDPTLRAGGTVVGSIALTAPESRAERSGDVNFLWEEVPGAVRYRLLLVRLADGEIADVGHTEETSLLASGEALTERLGPGAHDLHWIVRARLLDGSEVSSEPRRISWQPATSP